MIRPIKYKATSGNIALVMLLKSKTGKTVADIKWRGSNVTNTDIEEVEQFILKLLDRPNPVIKSIFEPDTEKREKLIQAELER